MLRFKAGPSQPKTTQSLLKTTNHNRARIKLKPTDQSRMNMHDRQPLQILIDCLVQLHTPVRISGILPTWLRWLIQKLKLEGPVTVFLPLRVFSELRPCYGMWPGEGSD